MTYAIVGFSKIGQALAHAFARSRSPVIGRKRSCTPSIRKRTGQKAHLFSTQAAISTARRNMATTGLALVAFSGCGHPIRKVGAGLSMFSICDFFVMRPT